MKTKESWDAISCLSILKRLFDAGFLYAMLIIAKIYGSDYTKWLKEEWVAEADSNNFSVIEKMKMIKEEVKKENGGTSPFQVKEHYTYDDFTKYDNEEFVRNVYIGLLKREADASGLEYHLNLLRSFKGVYQRIIYYV